MVYEGYSQIYRACEFYERLHVLSLIDKLSTSQNRVAAIPPNPNYFQLHELGRHLVHSSEAIDVALNSFRSLILQHESFMTEHAPKSSESRITFLRTHELLNFQLTILSSLGYRSLALQARLRNEIDLVSPRTKYLLAKKLILFSHLIQLVNTTVEYLPTLRKQPNQTVLR